MAALTAARVIRVPTKVLSGRVSLPLKAGSKAFQNGSACFDTASAGAVTQAAVSTTLIAIGRFQENLDNSAGGSALPVAVLLDREHNLSYWDSVTGGGAITIANLFAVVYWASDHELTTVSTGASKAGIVWDIGPPGYQGAVGIEFVEYRTP